MMHIVGPSRGGYSTYFTKSKSVHTLKGLALPRACHSGEITLAGSRRLHSTLAAAPVLFAHAVVTETNIGRIINPMLHIMGPSSYLNVVHDAHGGPVIRMRLQHQAKVSSCGTPVTAKVRLHAMIKCFKELITETCLKRGDVGVRCEINDDLRGGIMWRRRAKQR